MATVNPDNIRTDIPQQGSGDPSAPNTALSADERAHKGTVKGEFTATKNDIEALEARVVANVGGGAELQLPKVGLDHQSRTLRSSDGSVDITTEAQTLDLTVVGGPGGSPLTTKGDLYTRDASDDQRLGVGGNGQILSANSAQATGLEWIDAPSASGIGRSNPFNRNYLTIVDDDGVGTETLYTRNGPAGEAQNNNVNLDNALLHAAWTIYTQNEGGNVSEFYVGKTKDGEPSGGAAIFYGQGQAFYQNYNGGMLAYPGQVQLRGQVGMQDMASTTDDNAIGYNLRRDRFGHVYSDPVEAQSAPDVGTDATNSQWDVPSAGGESPWFNVATLTTAATSTISNGRAYISLYVRMEPDGGEIQFDMEVTVDTVGNTPPAGARANSAVAKLYGVNAASAAQYFERRVTVEVPLSIASGQTYTVYVRQIEATDTIGKTVDFLGVTEPHELILYEPRASGAAGSGIQKGVPFTVQELMFASDAAGDGEAQTVGMGDGELMSHNGTVLQKLALGADGQVIVARPGNGAGLKLSWENQASGGGYDTIQDDGAGVTQRTTMNYGAGISAVDNAGQTRTDIAAVPGEIDHDQLQNFVGDEHVAHSGVSITAGAGLTGGGTIAATRSLDVGAGDGISVAADSVAVDATVQRRISGGANGNIVSRDANGDVQDGGFTAADALRNVDAPPASVASELPMFNGVDGVSITRSGVGISAVVRNDSSATMSVGHNGPVAVINATAGWIPDLSSAHYFRIDVGGQVNASASPDGSIAHVTVDSGENVTFSGVTVFGDEPPNTSERIATIARLGTATHWYWGPAAQ